MDGLFDLEGFFFSSAATQKDGKVNTKVQYILECKTKNKTILLFNITLPIYLPQPCLK
jgi:hypothetical protein